MILPKNIPSEITILGVEAQEIRVEEFANFLRDLVFLHDRLWMMASAQFREKLIGKSWFYGRYGRAIPVDQQLRLISFRKESPFQADILIASAILSAPVAWTYFRILRGALLLPGEIAKQDADLKKTEGEIAKQRLETVKLGYEIEEKRRRSRERARTVTHELQEDLREFPQSTEEPFQARLELVERDIERLNENEILVTDITVRRYVRTPR